MIDIVIAKYINKLLVNKQKDIDNKILKGNLEKLYKNKIVKNHLNINFVGYLNHKYRTNETDKELEDILKYNIGLNPKLENIIANWMFSRNAKQFMDRCDNLEFFKENIVENLL